MVQGEQWNKWQGPAGGGKDAVYAGCEIEPTTLRAYPKRDPLFSQGVLRFASSFFCFRLFCSSIFGPLNVCCPTKVDAERATCSALDDSDTLLELIRQNGPGATEIRLKLRTEIRRRVRRIDVTFKDGVLSTAVITLVTGYVDKILFGQR